MVVGPSLGKSPRGPYHLSQSWLDGNIESPMVMSLTAQLRPSKPRKAYPGRVFAKRARD